MRLSIVVLSLLSLLVPGLASAGDLAAVTRRMTGSFSSAPQAAVDDAYFDIRLEMKPIWRHRRDGRWFYVEQAAASALERPYRQRVYQVTRRPDGSLRSRVFSLPEPLEHAGAWKDDKPLAELDADDLELRQGCDVILHRVDAHEYAGSTIGRSCQSSLRGATYATSEVRVFRDRIESWDRGFDRSGKQVWGATAGAYVFTKTAR
ncbi:MAG: chromophore lyase CpcT/CpeT [Acidobacteriota bacterium]